MLSNMIGKGIIPLIHPLSRREKICCALQPQNLQSSSCMQETHHLHIQQSQKKGPHILPSLLSGTVAENHPKRSLKMKPSAHGTGRGILKSFKLKLKVFILK
jgi:hypothetical protein